MKRSERIAVIGVGILGAIVGWNLSRHGANVVFIDAGRPGEGIWTATRWWHCCPPATAPARASSQPPTVNASSSRPALVARRSPR
ncbi:FAD-dependent oxidoreductase [Streptomyces sp. NPDC005195]|uniref:FAD-dependent oxidoreductase n=1 Tax=Streptomyces sp. NPDC005195 TaxID=3154561 RepID=UPI0033BBC377